MKLQTAVVFVLLLTSSPSFAAPIQWSISQGGNGHYYELVESSLVWHQARLAAASRTWLGVPGHLATITSASENDFVVAQLLTTIPADYVHVFMGATDEVVEGRFEWITGEPFIYTNWKFGQPVDYINEDFGDYQKHSLDGLGSWGWNDLAGDYSGQFYLIEYPATPVAVPEPTTLQLLSVGSLGVVGTTWRRWRRRQAECRRTLKGWDEPLRRS